MPEPLILGDTGPGRPRIFAIGLNKTGTRSFHEAMTILGYKSLHWGGPSVRQQIESASDTGLPLLHNMDPSIDCFSDIGVLAKSYDILDKQYPGSLFVMTVRPIEDWLESRRRHVLNNQTRKMKGEYSGNFLIVDTDNWRLEYERHYRKIRKYFTGRDDLLEVDITTGKGWAPFCNFLGVQKPTEQFPHENKGK